MATRRGSSDVDRYFDRLPRDIESMLRGAGKAGAKVVADEVKARTPSDEVRDGVRTRSSSKDGLIKVTIDVKPGWARSVGIWLEYGTSEHIITVGRADDGKFAAASLVIGGEFVGQEVLHPGARAQPAFRPALDIKAAEAIAAAQGYINSRVSRSRIAGPGEPEEVGE